MRIVTLAGSVAGSVLAVLLVLTLVGRHGSTASSAGLDDLRAPPAELAASSAPEGSDASYPPAGGPPDWQECPTYTPGPHYRDFIKALPCPTINQTALCATVQVPLDYARRSDGKTIGYFVKKIPAPAARKGEVWLLEGGPGYTGMDLECMIEPLQRMTNGQLDIIIPDHRGTGRSTPLTCGRDGGVPKAVADKPCWQALFRDFGKAYVWSFSTTNAAQDPVEVMRRTKSLPRQDGHKVFIYAVSYGTYLASRMLKIFPESFDAVALDGIVDPRLLKFAWYGQASAMATTQLMNLCAADSLCRSHLGPVPASRLMLANNGLASGTLRCQKLLQMSKITGSDLRTRALFDGLLASHALNERTNTLIPALVLRLLRCSPTDAQELKFFLARHFPQGSARRSDQPHDGPPMFDSSENTNPLIMLNIGGSEMWQYNETLSPTELAQSDTMCLLGSNALPNNLPAQGVQEGYPTYPRDKWMDEYPTETRTPVLMMQGTVDPQTAVQYAWHTHKQFSYPDRQRLVHLEGSVHWTCLNGRSPISGSDDGCCNIMLASFLNSGGATVDTECIKKLLPIDFTGKSRDRVGPPREAYTRFWLNTSLLWGSE